MASQFPELNWARQSARKGHTRGPGVTYYRGNYLHPWVLRRHSTVFIPISAHVLKSAHPFLLGCDRALEELSNDGFRLKIDPFLREIRTFLYKIPIIFTKMVITPPKIDRFSIRNQHWKAGNELYCALIRTNTVLKNLHEINTLRSAQRKASH